MKSYIYKFIFVISSLAMTSVYSMSIQTTNRILARVGSKAITVLDVKKEMDRQLYMNDRKVFNDPANTYKYYAQNWKMVLNKIIQDEMLYLEAESLEYKIPSPEITKKVTQLFGENPVQTLKFLSLTPEQAREISNREIISEHMAWYQIWSKSFAEATPSCVQKAYEEHIAKLEMKDKWTYQALYVKGEDEGLVSDTSHTVATLLKHNEFTNLSAILEQIDLHDERVKVNISKDITLEKGQLSPGLFAALESLEEGGTTDIITGKSKGAYTGKILMLKERQKEPLPGFAEVSEMLKNGIVNTVGSKIATKYYEGLFKKYDVDGLWGDELGASTLEPFALQND